MNVDQIKSVIVSQRQQVEELFQKEKIVEREINLENVRPLLKFPNILAILGVRRSGKSVFTWMILKGERFGYINFFDERLASLRSEELSLVIQAFYELYSEVDYFVLDEIQRVVGWERFVSRIRTSKRIVITGSNSGLLRGNLSTFITGRHSDIVLFPFSFNEFLKINSVYLDKDWHLSYDNISTVKRLLNEFLIKGGFPEVHKFGTRILQGIYRDIVENDIISQHKIRNREAIRNLSMYLASNLGKEISFEKLKGYLGIKNGHTVAKYVGYMEESYMFFLLQRFSFKLKDQFVAPRKVYAIDNGMAGSIAFRAGQDIGRQMENIVFVELMRRNLYLELNQDLYYWKDHRGREVDFVLKKGNDIIELVQISYISGNMDINERETASLILASKELKCDALTVITWDYEAEESKEGKLIKYLPIWKWLLQTYTLDN